MSTAVANNQVTCAHYEVLRVEPPGDETTCGEFLSPFAREAGGRVPDKFAVDL